MVNDASSTCSEPADGDRREQEQVLLHEGEAPREHALQEQQEQRRHQRHEREKHEQHRQLAGDVLRPHQRLRQVDLQRVGAPIVGDQPRADIDRDDEDEEILLLEELPEGFGRRGEERGLLKVRADVQLHDADDEGHPREDQDPHEGPLPDQRLDARPRDDGPRAADGRLGPAVVPVTLIVNRHVSRSRRSTIDGRWSLFAQRLREHVLERRDARTQVTHLHAEGRRRR